MYETGGHLAPAIKRYLDGRPLQLGDIPLIRAYLCQWIQSPVWDKNPNQTPEGAILLAQLREQVLRIVDRSDIHKWVELAVEQGIDPL
jgi:hypothetical protein